MSKPYAFLWTKEKREYPWFTEHFYWPVRRFVLYDCWSYRHWRYLFRYRAWGMVQRSRRGWADADTWSFDTYLSGVMAGGLRRLAETKHGVPSWALEAVGANLDSQDGITHDDIDRADEYQKAQYRRWADTLEHYVKHDTYAYEEELACYETTCQVMREIAEKWGSLWD